MTTAMLMRIITNDNHHCSIVGEGLNNGGRGINMVVLDTVNRHLQRVVRFDTYQEGESRY